MVIKAILAAMLVLAGTFGADRVWAQKPEGQLLKYVAVSRHGVRSPTLDPGELNTWSRQPWPEWPCCKADLTDRGGRLVSLMGAYYRDYLDGEGVFVKDTCPSHESVYVYADVAERTRATAASMLKGFAPTCALPVWTGTSGPVDAVYHPVQAGVCTMDQDRAKNDILKRAGGSVDKVFEEPANRAALATLQSVLGCCQPELCKKFGKGDHCTLSDLPDTIVADDKSKGVSLHGKLDIASTAAEVLLLEYAQGFDKRRVGWGRVDPGQMLQTFRLHTLAFDVMQRTPYVAARLGSSLLAQVDLALGGPAVAGRPVGEEMKKASFVFFGGHDTNIANLAAMLDTTWKQNGYQKDQTPPAGALVFELRRRADQSLWVSTSYVAQSLAQLRGAPSRMTPAAAPTKTPLKLPGCSTNDAGYPCKADDFHHTIARALDTECLSR